MNASKAGSDFRAVPSSGLFFGVLLSLVLPSAFLQAADAKIPAALTPSLSPADVTFFENKVRPVLIESCYKCHSHDADRLKGGLLLDTPQGILSGGDTGPAIVPGKPGDSLLITCDLLQRRGIADAAQGQKNFPTRKLPISPNGCGAARLDPRGIASKNNALPTYGGVGKNHWAFQPVKKPVVPVPAFLRGNRLVPDARR